MKKGSKVTSCVQPPASSPTQEQTGNFQNLIKTHWLKCFPLKEPFQPVSCVYVCVSFLSPSLFLLDSRMEVQCRTWGSAAWTSSQRETLWMASDRAGERPCSLFSTSTRSKDWGWGGGGVK